MPPRPPGRPLLLPRRARRDATAPVGWRGSARDPALRGRGSSVPATEPRTHMRAVCAAARSVCDRSPLLSSPVRALYKQKQACPSLQTAAHAPRSSSPLASLQSAESATKVMLQRLPNAPLSLVPNVSSPSSGTETFAVLFFLAVADKGDGRRTSQRKRWQAVMEPSHRRPWRKR